MSGSSSTSTSRIVDERRSDLDPLAHALGELTDRLVADLVELDLFERPPCDRSDIVGFDALGACRDGHELAGGQVIEERVLLRHEADRSADVAVATGILAQHPQSSPRRWGEAAQHAEQGRLPGTVRAEQRRHAIIDGEAHLADRDDGAVELRHVVDRDHPGQRGSRNETRPRWWTDGRRGARRHGPGRRWRWLCDRRSRRWGRGCRGPIGADRRVVAHLATTSREYRQTTTPMPPIVQARLTATTFTVDSSGKLPGSP